jgi:hypothetical protein
VLSHAAALPTGIDIAYLLSGAAYHTERDTLDAIRPGVLQETGHAMRAGIKSLGGVLAAAAEADAAAGGGSELQELLEPSDHRRMFVSIAGAIMVSYSAALARVLHTAPLLLVLTTPYVLPMLVPYTVSGACV